MKPMSPAYETLRLLQLGNHKDNGSKINSLTLMFYSWTTGIPHHWARTTDWEMDRTRERLQELDGFFLKTLNMLTLCHNVHVFYATRFKYIFRV